MLEEKEQGIALLIESQLRSIDIGRDPILNKREGLVCVWKRIGNENQIKENLNGVRVVNPRDF